MVFRGVLTYKTHEEIQTGMRHVNMENVNDNGNTSWQHKGFIKGGTPDSL